MSEHAFSRRTLFKTTGVGLASVTGLARPAHAQSSAERQRWAVSTDRPVNASPTLVDGTVFVGTGTQSEGALYAVEASTGQRRWTFDARVIMSSPAVVDGTVFVGSMSDNAGRLLALDAATGTKQWTVDTGPLFASPTVVGTTVFVGAMTANASNDFSARAVDSGTERWTFTRDAQFSASPTVVDDTVVVGTIASTDDGALYAIDRSSGQPQWVFDTGPIVSSPTVAGGTVLVGTADGYLHAVAADSGQSVWQFKTGAEIFASPTVFDGTVFVGSYDSGLYAVDVATGEPQWRFEADDWFFSSPTVVDGVVFVGNHDSTLYAVDADSGQQRWTFDTGGPIVSSPTVVDGTVYVGSEDGTLYAIEADIGGLSTGSRVTLGTLGHHQTWAETASAVEQRTITGTVTDPDGHPVVDATIRLPLASDTLRVQTDSEGRFALDLTDYTTPETVTIFVDKSGFSTASTNVAPGDSVTIKLQPNTASVVQLSDEIHHLGDGRYSGDINSQFQEPVEGSSLDTSFTLTTVQASATEATLRLTARGAQHENPIRLNDVQIGLLDTSDPSGDASELTRSVPVDVLQAGENELRIEAGTNPRNYDDIDDFEISNIQLRLTGIPTEPFDPAVHGFGFDNYSVADFPSFSRVADTVRESLLPELEDQDINIVTNPLGKAAFIGFTYSMMERLPTGECLGMSLAAREYYTSGLPDLPEYSPPEGELKTAADLLAGPNEPDSPEHYPPLAPVEQDIDEYQNSQLFDSDYLLRYVTITGLNDPPVDDDAVIRTIHEWTSNGGVVPLILHPGGVVGHMVLAYGCLFTAPDDADAIEDARRVRVLVYDPNYPAEAYARYDSSQLPYLLFNRPSLADSFSYSGGSVSVDTDNIDILVTESIDPNYSIYEGSLQGFETALSSGLSSYLAVGVQSPVSVEVTTPEGESLTRVDADRQALKNATGYEELHYGIGTPSGTYTIDLTATGSGSYTVAVQGSAEDGGRIEERVSGTVSPGDSKQHTATIPDTPGASGSIDRDSPDGNPIAPYRDEQTGEVDIDGFRRAIDDFTAGDISIETFRAVIDAFAS